MAHVIVALGFASICWQPTAISFMLARAYNVTRLSSDRIEDLMFTAFLFFFILSIQLLLPAAYLWIIRFQNLHAAGETSALQADVKEVLHAAALLKQRHEAHTTYVSDDSPSAASDQSPVRSQPLCENAEHLSTTEASAPDQASGPQPAQPSGGQVDCSKAVESYDAASCPSNQSKCTEHEELGAQDETLDLANRPEQSKKVHDADSVGASSDSCQNLQTHTEIRPGHAEEPAATTDFEQQDPEAFRSQVAAALETSSQIIANLTARMEARVYFSSGTDIQGHAACSAALSM